MKFALMGVGSGSTVRPDVLAEVARKGEELGFESAWIPEHLAVPVEMKARYPGSADGKFPGGPGVALHDPFVALSFVAAQTTRLKLGTGVFVLPLRNTLSVAKAVASLDVLSQGRVLFGIGVGWCEEELTPLACRSQTGPAGPGKRSGSCGRCGPRKRPGLTAPTTVLSRSALTPNRSSSRIHL